MQQKKKTSSEAYLSKNTATSRSKTWVWTVLHNPALSLTTEDHSRQVRKSEFDTTEHLVCSHCRLTRIRCLRDLCTPPSTRDLASLTLRRSRIRFIVTTNPEIDSLPCRSLGKHCANLKETPDKQSYQLSVLHPPGLGKLSQLLTHSKQLYGSCWSCQLVTLPLQVRREYRKKKKIITKLLDNISLSAESAVDTITFSFSVRVCALVCMHFPHPISHAYDVSNHAGLLVHSQPDKPFPIRSISSCSRLYCLHILGDQMSVLLFIT